MLGDLKEGGRSTAGLGTDPRSLNLDSTVAAAEEDDNHAHSLQLASTKVSQSD
jgi:hypothetical protein